MENGAGPLSQGPASGSSRSASFSHFALLIAIGAPTSLALRLLKAGQSHSCSTVRATALVMTGHSTVVGMYGRSTFENSHSTVGAVFQV